MNDAAIKARRLGIERDAAASYGLDRHCPQGGHSFYRATEWGVAEPNAPDTLAARQAPYLLGVYPSRVEHTIALRAGMKVAVSLRLRQRYFGAVATQLRLLQRSFGSFEAHCGTPTALLYMTPGSPLRRPICPTNLLAEINHE